MGVNSLPKTVTRQRSDCDLNPVPTAPESSMLYYFARNMKSGFLEILILINLHTINYLHTIRHHYL